MLERILITLDGSEISELALPYAEELAHRLHSEVSLLYVCEPGESEHRHMYEAYLETTSHRIINAVSEQSHRSTDAAVKMIVLEGSPAAQITSYAETNSIGLIIMASHGRSGLMPWAMGSTAAKVAQHLRVPVLIVRASPPPHGRPSDSLFQNILIPLDGSEAGESALPYVRELAQQIEMNVTLLRVIASGQYVHTAGGLNYFSFPEQLIQNMRVEADQYLEKVQGEFSGTKAVVACEVKAGNAAQEIIKSCDENGIQLVAMSSHGHSGIERWILGSVSYKVLHSGKTPLLLVKAVPKTSV